MFMKKKNTLPYNVSVLSVVLVYSLTTLITFDDILIIVMILIIHIFEIFFYK